MTHAATGTVTTELLVRDAIWLRAGKMPQEFVPHGIVSDEAAMSERMSRMTRRYPASDQPSCATVPATTPEARRRYLNTEEAAEIVRLSPRTLERLRKEGSGPRYLKPGKGNSIN